MKPFVLSLILLTLYFPDSAFSYTHITIQSTPPPSVHFIQSEDNNHAPLELDQEAHDVNDIYLVVSNQGPITQGFFPRGTQNNYVFGSGFWFGAMYDADDDSIPDKVFSQGYNPIAGDSEFREGRGDQDPDDPLTRVFDSTDSDDLAEWPIQFSDLGSGEPIVYSDQDLVTTYTTKDKPPNIGQFQLPLEVNQRSMAVFEYGPLPHSFGQTIFFLLEVTNRGEKVLNDSWVGFDSDMDVGYSFNDDLCSVIFDRITTEGDTVKLDIGYIWDWDFDESNFDRDPGFVGVSLLLGPGNPHDGIDNDKDGLVDESPFNGIDDDLDGFTDEWDEVDEIGLVNFSRHCSRLCPVMDPYTDEEGYDILSCNTEGSSISCWEGSGPGDIRYMISSGPFDWLPGQTHTFAFAYIFANPVGSPPSLEFVGDPPRPDPNDPVLGELVFVAEQARDFFFTLFPALRIGENAGGTGLSLPKTFSLSQNYPNPFNPSTTIAVDLPGAASATQPVNLTVYDIRGRRVRTLIDSDLEPGSHKIHWNGRNDRGESVSSGIYLYTLKTREGTFTRKMMVLK
jgi:hypothetical protein